MRTIGLVAIAMTGLGLSGCSQISGVFKKKPHYHTNDGTAIYLDSEASLRTTPQQPYQFADQTYGIDIYDSASHYTGYGYAGYDVDVYGAQPSYNSVSYTDPRQAEFVMLNGDSNVADWQNCESRNQGYLYMSEDDFRLNPGFEVCMRNKGYVLTSEYSSSTSQRLSAQTARLRGYSQPAYSQAAYSQPYSQPIYSQSSYSTSAYTGYIQ